MNPYNAYLVDHEPQLPVIIHSEYSYEDIFIVILTDLFARPFRYGLWFDNFVLVFFVGHVFCFNSHCSNLYYFGMLSQSCVLFLIGGRISTCIQSHVKILYLTKNNIES